MSTLDPTAGEERSAADVIGGLMAAASLFLSGIAIGLGLVVELEARPVRTAGAAIILALVASLMTRRHRTLAFAATIFATIAWVVGLTVAVITENPLL